MQQINDKVSRKCCKVLLRFELKWHHSLWKERCDQRFPVLAEQQLCPLAVWVLPDLHQRER